MFRYVYPVFEHKNLLKKSMLDELRDYPLSLSKMYFADYGDGILEPPVAGAGARGGGVHPPLYVAFA